MIVYYSPLFSSSVEFSGWRPSKKKSKQLDIHKIMMRNACAPEYPSETII